MRKTFLYITILAALALCIWFFIFRKTDNPYGATEAGFTVKDTSLVGKLFLAGNSGETITVERKPEGWILNGKYKALPGTVNMVLATLNTQAALYPVTKAAYDNVIKVLSTENIKVEVYGRDGKKITVFYVGGTAASGNGTNMLMEGAKMPYVVQTPAFNGDLRPRYSTNFGDWRDRTVFNIAPADMRSISVQYSDKDKAINSYVASVEKDTFKVKADPSISKNMDTLNTGRVKQYFTFFQNINCEGYMNGLEGMDSTIRNTQKRCEMEVTTVQGKQHLDIYWMPLNRRSRNRLVSDEDVPDQYDADRMLAVISGDTLLIQNQTFRKLMRKSYEFYQKDAPHAPQQYKQPKNVLIHKN